MRARFLIHFVAGLALAQPVTGQETESQAPAPPCSAPEFRQFDFWLGTWDLSWQGGTGENHITRPLGDCVIQERFAAHPTADQPPFQGLSVSTYDPQSAQWRQTWVDNNGGYLVFTGGLEGEDMILYGGSEDVRTRMIFTDITADAITWHWERSTDGGETWESNWIINYRRRTE